MRSRKDFHRFWFRFRWVFALFLENLFYSENRAFVGFGSIHVGMKIFNSYFLPSLSFQKKNHPSLRKGSERCGSLEGVAPQASGRWRITWSVLYEGESLVVVVSPVFLISLFINALVLLRFFHACLCFYGIGIEPQFGASDSDFSMRHLCDQAK